MFDPFCEVIELLKIGDTAPDFTLEDHNRNMVSLCDFRGKKNVVLSWHVYSFTDGWTSQQSSFRDANSKFEECDAQVLGISTDARPTQAAYTLSLGSSLGYPLPMLSDFYPHGEVAKKYDIFNENLGTSLRAVIIIDKQGIIRFNRTYTSAADIDVDDILAKVELIQE